MPPYTYSVITAGGEIVYATSFWMDLHGKLARWPTADIIRRTLTDGKMHRYNRRTQEWEPR